MRKLLIKIFSIIIMTLIICSSYQYNVNAEKVYDSKLIDFTFSYEEVYLQDKIKVKITFKTEESISYLKVISKLENGQEEVSFETGRPNEGKLDKKTPENENELWGYELTFHIEYVQLGTLEMKFEYSFDFTTEKIYENIFYIPAGTWVDIEKIPLIHGIVGGVAILIITLIATYVIIGFTRTKVFYNENERIEDE